MYVAKSTFLPVDVYISVCFCHTIAFKEVKTVTRVQKSMFLVSQMCWGDLVCVYIHNSKFRLWLIGFLSTEILKPLAVSVNLWNARWWSGSTKCTVTTHKQSIPQCVPSKHHTLILTSCNVLHSANKVHTAVRESAALGIAYKMKNHIWGRLWIEKERQNKEMGQGNSHCKEGQGPADSGFYMTRLAMDLESVTPGCRSWNYIRSWEGCVLESCVWLQLVY